MGVGGVGRGLRACTCARPRVKARNEKGGERAWREGGKGLKMCQRFLRMDGCTERERTSACFVLCVCAHHARDGDDDDDGRSSLFSVCGGGTDEARVKTCARRSIGHAG